MKREELSETIGDVLVNAHKQGDDVGGLLAAALQDAADYLGSIDALVAGRPDSREAAILMQMAQMGGSASPDFINALAELFIAMGQAHEDGGEVLSLACSHAVDQLGGFVAFAGGSAWWEDLCNLGKQFSRERPDDPYRPSAR